ncbi:MAG: GGDEF domain-containing protein [Pirellulaceae bacterium]
MNSVLLLSDDDARVAQWLDWLSDSGLSIQTAVNVQSVRTRRIDCIVTDRNLVTEIADADMEMIGLIVIGVRGFGDVQLAEGSRKELRLACRLVGRITQLRRQKKRQTRLAKVYEQLSVIDPLTRLANRRGWEQFLKRSTVSPDGVLAFFDLDDFRLINQEQGYQHGDQVIRDAAEALQQALPPGAFLARWGGDEFICLLSTSTPQDTLNEVRNRWLDKMAQSDKSLSITIGWSRFHAGQPEHVWQEFGQAEQALREAKQRQLPVYGAPSRVDT